MATVGNTTAARKGLFLDIKDFASSIEVLIRESD